MIDDPLEVIRIDFNKFLVGLMIAPAALFAYLFQNEKSPYMYVTFWPLVIITAVYITSTEWVLHYSFTPVEYWSSVAMVYVVCLLNIIFHSWLISSWVYDNKKARRHSELS